MDKSNIARQLAHLEKSGYICRKTDAGDRRLQLVYPTEKAQAVYPQVTELMQRWDDVLTRDFTLDERTQLFCLLERAMNRAQQEVEKL